MQHQLLLVNKEVNSRKLKKKKELRDGCLYVAGIGVEIGEKEITVFHFKAYNSQLFRLYAFLRLLKAEGHIFKN